MIAALKTIIPFLMAFTAVGLAFAALRIGLRATPQPDPFSRPFGEMPVFTTEQLRRIAPPIDTDDPLRRSFVSRNEVLRDSDRLWREFKNSPSAGLALRPDAGSVSLLPTGSDAARIDPHEVFEGCWRCGRDGH